MSGEWTVYFKAIAMAISDDNYVIKGLSGTVGQLLTFRRRGAKTIVQKYRRRTTIPPTQKLQSVRMNFASCIAYAKKAIKNPVVKAAYQAAAKDGQTAFNVATSDALNPPELTKINFDDYHGMQGDEIRVGATDDFSVETVTISIHLATGELIEEGMAHVPPDTTDWIYIATKENPVPTGSRITVSARDLPGNSSSLSIVI
jgi:hypothetical protein